MKTLAQIYYRFQQALQWHCASILIIENSDNFILPSLSMAVIYQHRSKQRNYALV